LNISQRSLCIIIVSVFITACSREGVSDSRAEDTIFREARCVAAAERFGLYKDAQTHQAHGLEAVKVHFATTGIAENFMAVVADIREQTSVMSLEFSARTLEVECERPLKVYEFNQSSRERQEPSAR
jgi:hypothetical protein